MSTKIRERLYNEKRIGSSYTENYGPNRARKGNRENASTKETGRGCTLLGSLHG